jgi:hypothetical protein
VDAFSQFLAFYPLCNIHVALNMSTASGPSMSIEHIAQETNATLTPQYSGSRLHHHPIARRAICGSTQHLSRMVIQKNTVLGCLGRTSNLETNFSLELDAYSSLLYGRQPSTQVRGVACLNPSSDSDISG